MQENLLPQVGFLPPSLPLPWGYGDGCSVSATQAAPAGFRAGGRTFGSTADASTVTAQSVINNLATGANGFGILVLGKVGALGANKYIAAKTGATTTNGWTFIHGNLTVNGQLRGIVGGTTYWDKWGSTADVAVTGQFEAHGMSFKTANGVKLFRGVLPGTIAEVGYAVGGQVGATPGSENAANLIIGNNSGLALNNSGDLSWVILFNTEPTIDDFNLAKQGALACQAGDWDFGLGILLSMTNLALARFIANDGSTWDYTLANPAGVYTASGVSGTTAGTSLENDAAGTKLNQLFVVKNLEDDIEDNLLLGISYKNQIKYRYAGGYSQKRYITAATRVDINGYGTFFSSAYGAQQSVGVIDDTTGLYLGEVLSGRSTPGTAGPFAGAVTGMSASSKTLCIVNGPRSRTAAPPSEAEPQQGTFASLVYFNASATEVAPAIRTTPVHIFGDSNLEGFVATPTSQLAAMQRYRRNLGGSNDGVKHCGFGGWMLDGMTSNATLQTSWVRRLVIGNPSWIIIGTGANDKINSTISPSTFQTRLQGFCNELLAQPDWTGNILIVSPFITTTQEGATGGFTMDDFRNVFPAVSATSARITHLVGKTTVSVGNISGVDGVHVLNPGQLEILNAVAAIIGAQPTMLTVTGSPGRSGTTTGTVSGTGTSSAVLLAASTDYAETGTATSAIGTATAIAMKFRVKGDALITGGFVKWVQIDQTRTTNVKYQVGWRSDAGVWGFVMWNSTDGSFSARQAFANGGNPSSTIDSARYYLVYAHYDPSSGTEIFRSEVFDDTGTLVASGTNNTQITGALPNNAAYGNVRIHRASDGTPGIDMKVDGLALYSAIVPSGSRSTEPTAGDTNLLAYWPINEGAGTTLAEINSGQSMTLTNGSWISEGVWPTTGANNLVSSGPQGRSGTTAISNDVALSSALTQDKSGVTALSVLNQLVTTGVLDKSSLTTIAALNNIVSSLIQDKSGSTTLSVLVSLTSSISATRSGATVLSVEVTVNTTAAVARGGVTTGAVEVVVGSAVAQNRTQNTVLTVLTQVVSDIVKLIASTTTGTVLVQLVTSGTLGRTSTTDVQLGAVITLTTDTVQIRGGLTTLINDVVAQSVASQSKIGVTAIVVLAEVATAVTLVVTGSMTGVVDVAVTSDNEQIRNSVTQIAVAAALATVGSAGRAGQTEIAAFDPSTLTATIGKFIHVDTEPKFKVLETSPVLKQIDTEPKLKLISTEPTSQGL